MLIINKVHYIGDIRVEVLIDTESLTVDEIISVSVFGKEISDDLNSIDLLEPLIDKIDWTQI